MYRCTASQRIGAIDRCDTAWLKIKLGPGAAYVLAITPSTTNVPDLIWIHWPRCE